MKKSRYAAIFAVFAALLLLSSCSSFFKAGVNGKVEFEGTPVSGAKIALYLDEGQCDADYANYLTTHAFSTNAYTAESNDLGSFSIVNIPWDTISPEFGKDADQRTVWLLFYHPDYGIGKKESLITSGTSKYETLSFTGIHEKNVVVRFSVAGNEAETETGFRSFKVSYTGHPASSSTEQYVQTVTAVVDGTFSFSVRYTGENAPAITLSDFTAKEYTSTGEAMVVPVDLSYGSGRPLESETYSGDKYSNGTITIPSVKYVVYFGGFSGTVSSSAVNTPATVKLFVDEKEIESKTLTSQSIISNYSFEDLGKGYKIVNSSYSMKPEVSCQIRVYNSSSSELKRIDVKMTDSPVNVVSISL